MGESAEKPIFIETMARRGYRFIGNIEASGAPVSSRPTPSQWLFTSRTAVLGAVGAAFSIYLKLVHAFISKARRPAAAPVVRRKAWSI